MNRDLLRLRPKNLPVYVYQLQAYVAVVHGTIAYKFRGYSFSNMRVVSNQPLRPGDVVNNNCCYYGNEYIEIIPHICIKGLLGGAEIELGEYYGCQINQLAISYVEDHSHRDSCGVGCCTVFIPLSASQNLDYWKKLIPDWDERLECIGEVPSDLMY